MNSLLRIQVRVNAKAANANLAALTTQLTALAAASAKVTASTKGLALVGAAAKTSVGPLTAQNTAINRVNKSLRYNTQLSKQHAGVIGMMNHAINGASTAAAKGLLGMSKNLQWIGRQLNFNFTIPLGIAAAAATNWALDVERSFTRVRKVYGDDPTKDYTKELDQIARGTRLLSDYFGVAQEQVNMLAADFAAAGAEGGALLKSVETGLQLQILGDYENAQDAFSGLLTIQKAFRLSTEETASVIALLNTVENRTAASLPGLVEGMEKAGAAASGMGVDFRELAAAIAAMTPTAGSPEEIGTSLKTTISRLADTTPEIANAFKEIGINIASMLNEGKDAMEILREMAFATEELSDAERARLASILGGRRQYNRVLALWDDMVDSASVYDQVMRDLDPSKDIENIARAQKEIDTLLESDPRKLKILTEQIKNLAIDAIQPMIPVLIGLVAGIRNAFTWFNNLDPVIQKYIATGLAAVVATGILAQFIGSLGLLVGTLANFILKPILWIKLLVGGFLKTLAPVAMILGRFLISPWGIALVAIATAAAFFSEDIREVFAGIWNFIATGFNKLPESIANAMRAVVDILSRTAEAIANFFGSIFGVQVDSGVKTNIPRPAIGTGQTPQAFATGGIVQGTGEVPAILHAGEMVLTAEQQATLFKLATASIRDANKARIRGEQVAAVESGAPGAGASLNDLFAQLDVLEGALEGVGSALEMQQAVVDALDEDYEKAADAVDNLEKAMEPLEDRIDSLNDTLDAANSKISELARVPLEGMGAMADAIFENQIETKKLKLALLQLGDAADSYEDIRSKINAINGDIEMLRGKMASLREAGAGSEILDVYQKQLDALESQRDALKDQSSEAEKIEKELSALEKAGQILELQQSITFDPLVRQIEEMANGVAEMPFDLVVEQIREQQDIIAATNVDLAAATAEYDKQAETLALLKAREEEIAEARDVEQEKLDDIKSTYDDIKNTISDIEKLINDTVQAQEELTRAASGGAGGAAGGGIGGGMADLSAGDFDDPLLPDVDWGDLDLPAQIKRLEDAIADAWDDWDVFGPLQDAWDGFKAQLKTWWDGFVGWVKRLPLPNIDFGKIGDSIGGFFESIGDSQAWEIIVDFFNNLMEAGSNFGRAFWTTIQPALDELVQMGHDLWDAVVPAFKTIAGTLGILAQVIGPLLPVLGELAGILAGNAFNAIVTNVAAAFRIFAGAVQAVFSLLTADWEGVVDGLGKILDGLVAMFTAPWEIIKGFVLDLAGWFREHFGTIGEEALFGLLDGLGAIWDTVASWFRQFPQTILGFVKSGFGIFSPSQEFFDIGISIIEGLLNGLNAIIGAVSEWFIGLPLQVLAWVGDVTGTLVAKGRDLLNGLLRGITEGWLGVAGWLFGLGVKVVTAVGDVAGQLWTKGWQLITGLKNGFTEAWEGIKWVFTGLGERIWSAIGDLGGKLYDRGRALVDGLVSGMKSRWNSFANWWNSRIGGLGVTVPGLGWRISVVDMPTLHSGGVVPGRGEVSALLRAGEMVLTPSQQARLFAMANGKEESKMIQSGPRTINFYGDLSFPNITDAGDAEVFISNLEALAGAN